MLPAWRLHVNIWSSYAVLCLIFQFLTISLFTRHSFGEITQNGASTKLKKSTYNPQALQNSHACSPSAHLHNILRKSSKKTDFLKFSDAPKPVRDLKICRNGLSCCSKEIEEKLLAESQLDFRTRLEDKIWGLGHTFESRTVKMDNFFRHLLQNARADLHQMFKRTYGLLYERNSDIFSKFFDDLTFYYKSPTLSNSSHTFHEKLPSLDAAMDNFYQHLYQRMFQILNQPLHFDALYFECMAALMQQLKPFGDGPEKMKQQINRSLVGAKTFVHGLSVGRDFVREMVKFKPSNDCKEDVLRVTYCSFCEGQGNLQPCNSACVSVMKNCLADQVGFDVVWNDYLEALAQLLDRLQGPFNIELVIDPINVQISDAIMTFQDRGKEITDEIFKGCGRPRINKRSANKIEVTTDNLALSSNTESNKAEIRPPSSLDRLVKDIREKLTLAKNFWHNLPVSMCNDGKFSAPNGNSRCLNDAANFKLAGLKFPLTTTQNSSISEQLTKLKLATARLRKAYYGEPVDFALTTLPLDFSNTSASRQKSSQNQQTTGMPPGGVPRSRGTSPQPDAHDDVKIEGSGSYPDDDLDDDDDTAPDFMVGSGNDSDRVPLTDDEDLLVETVPPTVFDQNFSVAKTVAPVTVPSAFEPSTFEPSTTNPVVEPSVSPSLTVDTPSSSLHSQTADELDVETSSTSVSRISNEADGSDIQPTVGSVVNTSDISNDYGNGSLLTWTSLSNTKHRLRPAITKKPVVFVVFEHPSTVKPRLDSHGCKSHASLLFYAMQICVLLLVRYFF